MGRTKSQHVELETDVELSGDINVSLNAMTEHRLEIMQQFGEGLPYERDRIVHETKVLHGTIGGKQCWRRVSD